MIIPFNYGNCINNLIISIVIEVSLGEYGDHYEKLVNYIENGKSKEWLNNSSQEYLVKGW